MRRLLTSMAIAFAMLAPNAAMASDKEIGSTCYDTITGERGTYYGDRRCYPAPLDLTADIPNDIPSMYQAYMRQGVEAVWNPHNPNHHDYSLAIKKFQFAQYYSSGCVAKTEAAGGRVRDCVH